jgi:predicted secreted acid phosphatase
LLYPELPDADHLYVFRETSDKTPARDEIMAKHDVVVTLGDNLNDYKRDYYVKNIDKRMQLMERDRDEFGREFILLPNLTDGHWVRAIFGDSEPSLNHENRRLLFEAAIQIA